LSTQRVPAATFLRYIAAAVLEKLGWRIGGGRLDRVIGRGHVNIVLFFAVAIGRGKFGVGP
jgi:hypothetical protein